MRFVSDTITEDLKVALVPAGSGFNVTINGVPFIQLWISARGDGKKVPCVGIYTTDGVRKLGFEMETMYKVKVY